MAELARSHIEALRGSHPLEDDEPAAGEAPSAFVHAAKAQGPPN